MSIISSSSKAVCSVLDTVASVGQSAQKSVGIATEYVDNRAIAFSEKDQTAVSLQLAKDLTEMQQELNSDDNLRATFNKVQSLWPNKATSVAETA